MNTKDVIILARKHVHDGSMPSSAELCLADAIRLYDDGLWVDAKSRAIKSLAYSVGIAHKDYKRASVGFMGVHQL